MAPLLLIAALYGLSGVALDALGAHALPAAAEPLRDAFASAVRHQLVHGVALIGIALLAARAPAARLPRLAGAAIALGVLLFSGSIHLHALLSIGPIPFAAPAGGILLMAGWALLALYALSCLRKSGPG
ncbi:MAG: DUF423 domain-containing protein [Alphaproteobacteria bacterium]